jgi:hypothetical protein
MDISRPGDFVASEHLYPDFRLPVDMFRFADNQGMILVYSINSRTSFTALENFVDARIREKRSGQVEPKVLCLIGNKLDSSRQGRKVLCIEAEELAAKIGCPFVECSAKDGKELNKVKNATLKGMDNQRQALIKIGGDADKKVRASTLRSASATSGLFRRFSEVDRSDTQRSSSSSEQELISRSSSTSRWKNAAATSPPNQKTTLSHSQMGARVPNSRTISSTTRIDEEDESTEESRSSSQQSSDQSLSSANTVTPPSNGNGHDAIFQPRGRLGRANSRPGPRVLTKAPPRSHVFQAPLQSHPVKSNEEVPTSQGTSSGVQASQLPEKADEIKRNDTSAPFLRSGVGSQTAQNEQQSGYTDGKGAVVAPPETVARSQSSLDTPTVDQNHIDRPTLAPLRSVTDRESFSERYAFIYKALAVKLPTEQSADALVNGPVKPPETFMDSQALDLFRGLEMSVAYQDRSPIEEQKVTLMQPVQSPVQFSKSILDDQSRNTAQEVKDPQPERVERVHNPVQEHNELEDERARLEGEKKRLEDQMKALEEQQKLLDERKKKGEEQRLKEEKEKRRQDKKLLLDKQETEKQQLIHKQVLERDALEARHKEEASKLQDSDDERDTKTGAGTKTNQLARSATSPTPTREASKFLQQKAIDSIWDRPTAPLQSTLARRQSAHAFPVSTEEPANARHEPEIQSPLIGRQSTQPSASSTTNTIKANTNEQPNPPIESETSRSQPHIPQRPELQSGRNSVGVTSPSQVVSLGTLFTMKNVKSTRKVSTPKAVVEPASPWTPSHPRLPFPGKYI